MEEGMWEIFKVEYLPRLWPNFKSKLNRQNKNAQIYRLQMSNWRSSKVFCTIQWVVISLNSSNIEEEGEVI